MTDDKKRETLVDAFKKTVPLWKEVVKDGEQAKVEKWEKVGNKNA